MKKLFKNNIKVIIALILGLVIAGSVGVYAYVISASDVSYDNSTSGLEADNVKDALDDLYSKIENGLYEEEVISIPYSITVCLSGGNSSEYSSKRCNFNRATGTGNLVISKYGDKAIAYIRNQYGEYHVTNYTSIGNYYVHADGQLSIADPTYTKSNDSILLPVTLSIGISATGSQNPLSYHFTTVKNNYNINLELIKQNGSYVLTTKSFGPYESGTNNIAGSIYYLRGSSDVLFSDPE